MQLRQMLKEPTAECCLLPLLPKLGSESYLEEDMGSTPVSTTVDYKFCFVLGLSNWMGEVFINHVGDCCGRNQF